MNLFLINENPRKKLLCLRNKKPLNKTTNLLDRVGKAFIAFLLYEYTFLIQKKPP